LGVPVTIRKVYYLVRHTSFLSTKDSEWSVIFAAIVSDLPCLLTGVDFYFRWLNHGLLV